MHLSTALKGLLFVILLAAMAGAFFLLMSAPALAVEYHGRAAFKDSRVFYVYDDTRYNRPFNNFVYQMNQENIANYGLGVRVEVVDDPAVAHTVVTDTVEGNYCGNTLHTSGEFGDVIRLRISCMERVSGLKRRSVVLHEGMHEFGFGSVSCEKRSVVNHKCGFRDPQDTLTPYDHYLYRTYIVREGI